MSKEFDNFMDTVKDYPELEENTSMCEYSGLPTVSSYLITADDYPELEGTMNLCNDIINNREISDAELDQVREAKNRHIKQQSYMIAALYREIERLLENQIKK